MMLNMARIDLNRRYRGARFSVCMILRYGVVLVPNTDVVHIGTHRHSLQALYNTFVIRIVV